MVAIKLSQTLSRRVLPDYAVAGVQSVPILDLYRYTIDKEIDT